MAAKLKSYQCVKCGTDHAPDLPEKWGVDPATIGYGATPVCVAILKAPNGDGYACRGALTPIVENVP